jgi:hypothetical protein
MCAAISLIGPDAPFMPAGMFLAAGQASGRPVSGR